MKDDIIRMAREAKVTPGLIGENGAYFARIEHLVELARAAEREACAKMVEDWDSDSADPRDIAAAIRARGNT